ncbi:MAG: hypothetical protein COA83_01920 [Methylophaga sp.]|nr:MAG: hypothetical protein COA83_01920 [Methylophaga sp.]
MFKKILIGIILFGIIAALLLQIDDDLDPEVAIFLEQAEPAKHSDAYVYLLGIVAAEDEEPLELGNQLLNAMRQAEDGYKFGDETFEFEAYPEDKKLILPTGELFCKSWQEGCWQAVFDNKHERDQALKTHAVLLQRYQTFIKTPDYQTLSKPRLTEVYPPFQYLLKANRLVILSAINKMQSAKPALAVSELTEHITSLRQHLKSADTVIGKMIFTKMISDNIDALSLIIQQQDIAVNDALPPISLPERDLEIAMAREVAMSYELYSSLDRSPEIFAHAKEGLDNNNSFETPEWVARAAFKPNMSVNQASLFYKETSARSQLAQTEFVFAVVERAQPQKLQIKNWVGSILNNIAKPNFDQYIAPLFDLNAKIAIFNQTANKVELPSDLSYIQNPYYETGGTAYYSEEGKSICLTGPLNDDEKLRCLRVKF